MSLNPAKAFDNLGQGIVKFLENWYSYSSGLVLLYVRSIGTIFSEKKKGATSLFQVLVTQTFFTGVEAIFLVSLIALMIGVLVTIQAFTLLASVGFADLFGKIMVLGVIRELGPLITTFIVICRTGSGLATYIGNMKVNGEIEALEVMGIDAIRYLIMPAMLGCILALFCLTLLFDGVAVTGGFFVGQLVGMDLRLETFTEQLFTALSPVDFFLIIIKSIIFGSIISTVACYHALSVKRSISEVPKRTIMAIVHSLVFAMVVNSILTVILYVFLLKVAL